MPVREIPRTLNQSPTTDEAPEVIRPRLDKRWMIPVLGTSVAALAAVQFLTPAPVHPDAQPMLIEQLLDTFLMGCIFFSAYGFVQRNLRMAYWGAAGFVWALLVGVASCPMSGHHMYGMWWGAQMALCLAAVATSTVAAVAHTRR